MKIKANQVYTLTFYYKDQHHRCNGEVFIAADSVEDAIKVFKEFYGKPFDDVVIEIKQVAMHNNKILIPDTFFEP